MQSCLVEAVPCLIRLAALCTMVCMPVLSVRLIRSLPWSQIEETKAGRAKQTALCVWGMLAAERLDSAERWRQSPGKSARSAPDP